MKMLSAGRGEERDALAKPSRAVEQPSRAVEQRSHSGHASYAELAHLLREQVAEAALEEEDFSRLLQECRRRHRH